ncbi:S8 family serine peptidase [Ectothiorhodospiraceae bacterium WFHF3C12]|nr:S8 family serine peptidase [Ectothiorhodospiraceae bacterium WFHF3C12]
MLTRTACQPRRSTLCATFLVALGQVACGGGGGGGDDGGDTNQAPTAAFDYTVSAGGPPTAVQFTAERSSDSDGTVVGYSWDFGNGATASGPVGITEYDSSGSYSATLEVTDDSGGSSTTTETIRIGLDPSYEVSGTVTVPTGTAADSDTADPAAPTADNDSASTAQAVSAPVTIGGYASRNSDRFDSFEVTLSSGDNVTLSIADYSASSPGTTDLDIYLYEVGNPGGSPVASSTSSSSAVESFSVPNDGDYFVVVDAYAGDSNYVLGVANGGLSVSGTLDVTDEFVPGEVLVRFRDGARSLAAAGTASAMASQMGLQHKAGDLGRPMLLSMGDHLQTQLAFDALGIDQQPGATARGFGTSAKARHKLATLQLVKKLSARDDVAAVSPNYIYQPQLVPNDEYYQYQWHYPQISLPQAWEETQGSGVVVAVVDTGIFDHPDLSGQLTGNGYDFISDTSRSLDGDGIDADPTDPGDQALPDGSSSFHGTHVAGTVAAASNNGTGVAGVAWNAGLMPIRVLGQGGGTTYDILQGLRYAAGMANDAGIILPVADRAQVINMSLGGPCGSTDFGSEFEAVRNGPDGTPDTADDVLLIAAAGNAGDDTPNCPASYDAVVSVSATDQNNELAPYSSYGDSVQIAAPGGDLSANVDGDPYLDGILSTAVNDSTGSPVTGYNFENGTSMASPHVAGVAALMKSVNNALTPGMFEAALAQGSLTTDLGLTGNPPDGPTERNDEYGYGLINAAKAVDWAADGQLSPLVEVSPTRLDFGNSTTSLSFTVGNATGDDGLLDNVNVTTSGESWLTVSATSTEANGTGEYNASVNREPPGDGRYTATITVTSDNGGETQVPVEMRVGSVADVADAGHQYIIIVDTVTGFTAGQVDADVNNGTYDFSITGVPAGSYLVLSGTDMDNDRLICDAGEACGAYPSVSELTAINVNDDTGDRTGLQFSTQFRLNLSSTAQNDAYSRDPSGDAHVTPAPRSARLGEQSE